MDWSKHQVLEKSSILLLLGILIVVAIGGLFEIAPLFWLSSTIENVQGMRPYTPLESMYDHPFQWGSKRTGPDLARVGGKYSDEWHVAHMTDPRAIVPESIMPGYPFLAGRALQYDNIGEHMRVLRVEGVPYSDEMIDGAKADLERQVDPNAEAIKDFLARYPKTQVRQFDGDPSFVSELDALIAYLQMLGTLVDFASFDAAGPNLR